MVRIKQKMMTRFRDELHYASYVGFVPFVPKSSFAKKYLTLKIQIITSIHTFWDITYF